MAAPLDYVLEDALAVAQDEVGGGGGQCVHRCTVFFFVGGCCHLCCQRLHRGLTDSLLLLLLFPLFLVPISREECSFSCTRCCDLQGQGRVACSPAARAWRRCGQEHFTVVAVVLFLSHFPIALGTCVRVRAGVGVAGPGGPRGRGLLVPVAVVAVVAVVRDTSYVLLGPFVGPRKCLLLSFQLLLAVVLPLLLYCRGDEVLPHPLHGHGCCEAIHAGNVVPPTVAGGTEHACVEYRNVSQHAGLRPKQVMSDGAQGTNSCIARKTGVGCELVPSNRHVLGIRMPSLMSRWAGTLPFSANLCSCPKRHCIPLAYRLRLRVVVKDTPTQSVGNLVSVVCTSAEQVKMAKKREGTILQEVISSRMPATCRNQRLPATHRQVPLPCVVQVVTDGQEVVEA